MKAIKITVITFVISISLFLVLIYFGARDYIVYMTGIVIDKESGQKLSNVNVKLIDVNDSVTTDNKGYFEIYRRPTRSVSKKIVVSKSGYKPFQITIENSDNDYKYIVKTERLSVNFDKPFYPHLNDSNVYFSNIDIEKYSQTFCAGDTLKIYLDKNDEKFEVEKIKSEMLKNWNK